MNLVQQYQQQDASYEDDQNIYFFKIKVTNSTERKFTTGLKQQTSSNKKAAAVRKKATISRHININAKTDSK